MRQLSTTVAMMVLCVSPLCGDDAAPTTGQEKSVQMVTQYKPEDFSRLYGMKGFSDNVLSMHFKLYEGYVKNTNVLRQKLQELVSQGKDRSPEYAGIKRMYGWEFDGMRLHEFYFGNLGGDGKLSSDSVLYQSIAQEFGSYDKWKQDFIATGMIRGIGWSVLYIDPKTGFLSNVWINEHNLNHLAGAQPILIMDVFEHAYLPDYGLDRNSYIQAFFGNINWSIAEKRHAEVTKTINVNTNLRYNNENNTGYNKQN